MTYSRSHIPPGDPPDEERRPTLGGQPRTSGASIFAGSDSADGNPPALPAWTPGRKGRERLRAMLRGRAAAAGRPLLHLADEVQRDQRRRQAEAARIRQVGA